MSGWWDVYSHLQLGPVDPWWNPAHLTLYAGIALTFLSIWRGLRTHRTPPPTNLIPIRFENLAGLKLAAVGTVVEFVAGVWNEIVHHVFQSEPRIAPAHALLTVGMLIVASGMIIGLSIEYGMMKHRILVASTFKRTLTLGCVVLTFASIWLAAGGALIYLARVFRVSPYNWINAVLLAVICTVVLVPAKRVLPEFGAALAVGIIFNAVCYFFLVAYAGETPYIPWGLLPMALFDVLILGLKRVMSMIRAGLVSSVVIGFFFWVTYFPFSLYLFPWSSSSQLSLAAVVLGSLAGAFLGNLTYAGLTSAVLGDVTG